MGGEGPIANEALIGAFRAEQHRIIEAFAPIESWYSDDGPVIAPNMAQMIEDAVQDLLADRAARIEAEVAAFEFERQAESLKKWKTSFEAVVVAMLLHIQGALDELATAGDDK